MPIPPGTIFGDPIDETEYNAEYVSYWFDLSRVPPNFNIRIRGGVCYDETGFDGEEHITCVPKVQPEAAAE